MKNKLILICFISILIGFSAFYGNFSSKADMPPPWVVTCVGCPPEEGEICWTCDYLAFWDYCCGCDGSSDACE